MIRVLFVVILLCVCVVGVRAGNVIDFAAGGSRKPAHLLSTTYNRDAIQHIGSIKVTVCNRREDTGCINTILTEINQHDITRHDQLAYFVFTSEQCDYDLRQIKLSDPSELIHTIDYENRSNSYVPGLLQELVSVILGISSGEDGIQRNELLATSHMEMVSLFDTEQSVFGDRQLLNFENQYTPHSDQPHSRGGRPLYKQQFFTETQQADISRDDSILYFSEAEDQVSSKESDKAADDDSAHEDNNLQLAHVGQDFNEEHNFFFRCIMFLYDSVFSLHDFLRSIL